MFTINKDERLTEQLLYKIINKFYMTVQPRLIKYGEYYEGIQDILKKEYSDESKPCSHIVTNFSQSLVDSFSGYIASPGYISYSSDNDIEDIMDVLRYNDYQDEDSNLLSNALIYGVSAELMYVDQDAKTRFKLINPTQCFGIYDDSLTNDLLYFVRIYKANEWDDSDKYYVDVYSDVDIKHYEMFGMSGALKLVDERCHYFNQCPANIFIMPDEKSIFDCILSLQDAYNDLLSGELDDFNAFCDAYLALTGVDAEEEDIVTMKQNRVLILPEGSKAEWLIKATNDTQVENLLKRIERSIYKVASCVDFNLENVGSGVSSGIAIRYRLSGMEQRAARIEALMKKALQRRIEIIAGIASLKLGESTWRDINITFTRNIPVDINETINTINALRGVVSDETLMGMIPQVVDVNEELEKVKAQKAEELLIYNFGGDA